MHQTLARGKQLGGSASKITSVLGSNKGGTNSEARKFIFIFIFSGWGAGVGWSWGGGVGFGVRGESWGSLLFRDFVIKRTGSDLQTMDSWFISTAGPCGRCSFSSPRHMQIPTVPPLSLRNCRLFRQQKEAHLCARPRPGSAARTCVCACRRARVLVRVQPYFRR